MYLSNANFLNKKVESFGPGVGLLGHPVGKMYWKSSIQKQCGIHWYRLICGKIISSNFISLKSLRKLRGNVF